MTHIKKFLLNVFTGLGFFSLLCLPLVLVWMYPAILLVYAGILLLFFCHDIGADFHG